MSEVPAIVDIADVITDVELVNPAQLEAGDVLFDTFGGELPLVSVRHFRHRTRTKRADGVWDSWPHDGGGVTRKVRWTAMSEREESLWHAGYFTPERVRETEHGVEYAS